MTSRLADGSRAVLTPLLPDLPLTLTVASLDVTARQDDASGVADFDVTDAGATGPSRFCRARLTVAS